MAQRRRRRSQVRQAERGLYFVDRSLLDLRAAARGHGALTRRLSRRYLRRQWFRVFRGL